MNHIAQRTEHAVVKTDPWTLIDLERGQQLTTSKEVDFYDNRADAIAAIKAEYPDFEPSEWHYDPQPRIEWLKRQLRETDYVGLADYDKDQPEIKAQRQAWREEIRELENEQH